MAAVQRAHPGDSANRNRRRSCQVEAIAAVPGVDALWIGHFDLTNFMAFRRLPAPRLSRGGEAHRRGVRGERKTAAFLAGDDAWAREYKSYGFRLFATASTTPCFKRR